MGGDICTPASTQPTFQFAKMGYEYGEDEKESKINHQGGIKCKSKELEIYLDDCTQKLKLSQRMYKDPTMKTDPIILKSIVNPGTEVKCTYQRPYQFLYQIGKGKKYKIIEYQDSRASDIFVRDQIMQYFGVFLCFIAQNPNLLNDILLTDANTYGVYVVQMNVGGRKESIFIDDYILCSGGMPLFAQPVKNIYMWAPLLQKAWLKVKGNTAKKIQKNTPEQVFDAFLSYPSTKHILPQNDPLKCRQIAQTHLSALEKNKGYVVTSRKEPQHKLGLSGRKYYYLLATFQLNRKKFYYLRNPCGLFQFRGEYRTPPQQMLDRIKSITNDVKITDGNFLMDQDQFYEQAEEIYIYHYSKSASIISEESISFYNNEEIFIQTELKSDGMVSFCFNQTNPKLSDLKYYPITYQIVSLNEDTLVSGLQNNEGCFGVKNTYLLDGITQRLKAGKYLIRIKKKALFQSKSTKTNGVINRIIAAASQPLKFQYIGIQQLNKRFNNFLRVEGKRRIDQRNRDGKKQRQIIDHIVCWMGDIVFIYIEKANKSKDEVQVQVCFSELQNLQCLSHKISRQFTSLPPFTDDAIIVFEKIDLTEETRLNKYTIQPF